MYSEQQNNSDVKIIKRVFKIVGAIIFGFFLIIAIFGSFFSIDESERGVVLRNGAFTRIANPGLNFKFPFIDEVKEIDIKQYSRHYQKVNSYSKDQQPAELHISVTYHIISSEEGIKQLYSTYKTVEGMAINLIDPIVPAQVKNVFGQYTAVSSIQDRIKLNHDINEAIKGAVKGPVVIESVQVQNIDFSKAYEQSVEARMKAEVEVQTQKQTLDKETISAEIVRTKARGASDAKLIDAENDAKAIRLRGDAEADAIRARAAALAENQNLVELLKAEKWDGKLPTSMIPGTTIPFLEVSSKK